MPYACHVVGVLLGFLHFYLPLGICIRRWLQCKRSGKGLFGKLKSREPRKASTSCSTSTQAQQRAILSTSRRPLSCTRGSLCMCSSFCHMEHHHGAVFARGLRLFLTSTTKRSWSRTAPKPRAFSRVPHRLHQAFDCGSAGVDLHLSVAIRHPESVASPALRRTRAHVCHQRSGEQHVRRG